jgi:hypothetical protein
MPNNYKSKHKRLKIFPPTVLGGRNGAVSAATVANGTDAAIVAVKTGGNYRTHNTKQETSQIRVKVETRNKKSKQGQINKKKEVETRSKYKSKSNNKVESSPVVGGTVDGPVEAVANGLEATAACAAAPDATATVTNRCENIEQIQHKTLNTKSRTTINIVEYSPDVGGTVDGPAEAVANGLEATAACAATPDATATVTNKCENIEQIQHKTPNTKSRKNNQHSRVLTRCRWHV